MVIFGLFGGTVSNPTDLNLDGKWFSVVSGWSTQAEAWEKNISKTF
jgi:hypothetical protein